MELHSINWMSWHLQGYPEIHGRFTDTLLNLNKLHLPVMVHCLSVWEVPFWLGRSEPSTHHIAENSGGLPAHPCLPSSCTPEGQQGLPAAPAAAWLNPTNDFLTTFWAYDIICIIGDLYHLWSVKRSISKLFNMSGLNDLATATATRLSWWAFQSTCLGECQKQTVFDHIKTCTQDTMWYAHGVHGAHRQLVTRSFWASSWSMCQRLQW